MTTPLDRESPVPLWAQLESDLRRRLDTGEFDTRFPTDMELTKYYGVSRHTVREAIAHLNRSGLLKRERGRGTVVNRTEFEQSLGALYSLFQSIESAGTEQRSEVLNLRTVTNSVAASRLGLDLDSELVFLERLRLAGDAPLAVDRAWMPATLARPLLEVDFGHTALYAELDAACGIRPNRGWERISPVIPSAADRRHLRLGKNDAAFELERLGCHGEEPVEWRNTVIRGDRYRFVASWASGSPSSDGELRLTPFE